MCIFPHAIKTGAQRNLEGARLIEPVDAAVGQERLRTGVAQHIILRRPGYHLVMDNAAQVEPVSAARTCGYHRIVRLQGVVICHWK